MWTTVLISLILPLCLIAAEPLTVYVKSLPEGISFTGKGVVKLNKNPYDCAVELTNNYGIGSIMGMTFNLKTKICTGYRQIGGKKMVDARIEEAYLLISDYNDVCSKDDLKETFNKLVQCAEGWTQRKDQPDLCYRYMTKQEFDALRASSGSDLQKACEIHFGFAMEKNPGYNGLVAVGDQHIFPCQYRRSTMYL
uniref:Uncharacterized protein n=1 Tax=Steinernema glaseri TaxID=37863 RepID=A0A1I8AFZ5_9BILA